MNNAALYSGQPEASVEVRIAVVLRWFVANLPGRDAVKAMLHSSLSGDISTTTEFPIWSHEAAEVPADQIEMTSECNKKKRHLKWKGGQLQT